MRINKNKVFANIIWAILCGGLIAADFFTKWCAETHFKNPIEILPGVFRLSFSLNPGIAFSIPIPNAVMIIAIPLLIALIAIAIVKTCKLNSPITKLGLTLIAAGGLGNLVSRLTYGAVIDFLDFSFWPSFNLADSFITVAAFILILFHGRITMYGGRK